MPLNGHISDCPSSSMRDSMTDVFVVLTVDMSRTMLQFIIMLVEVVGAMCGLAHALLLIPAYLCRGALEHAPMLWGPFMLYSTVFTACVHLFAAIAIDHWLRRRFMRKPVHFNDAS